MNPVRLHSASASCCSSLQSKRVQAHENVCPSVFVFTLLFLTKSELLGGMKQQRNKKLSQSPASQKVQIYFSGVRRTEGHYKTFAHWTCLANALTAKLCGTNAPALTKVVERFDAGRVVVERLTVILARLLVVALLEQHVPLVHESCKKEAQSSGSASICDESLLRRFLESGDSKPRKQLHTDFC